MILINSDDLSWAALNKDCHQRTLVMHSNLACCPMTQALEQNSRCNKDTCGNNSSLLKFTQIWVCPDPQTGPGSRQLPSVWSQHYCSTGSQHHSGPPPFTVLSLANVTQTSFYLAHLRLSKPRKQPIHGLIRKMTLSVCDLTGPGPSVV